LQLLELCTAERLLQVLACVEGGAALLEQAQRSAALGARRVVEQHGRRTPEERHLTHGAPAFGVLVRTEALSWRDRRNTANPLA